MHSIHFRTVIAIGLGIAVTACDELGIGGPPDDATVAGKMESGCGTGNRTSSGILDLEIGMTVDQARKVLDCYDPTALVKTGTSGTYENEVDDFLGEIAPGKGGYSNLLVWTRGQPRDCRSSSSDGGNSTELGRNLRPDDQRFSPLVFSGSLFPDWDQCFTQVKDQIVLRFGGAPDSRIVTGIWRLSVPGEGRRPRLSDLAAQLNGRYPMLGIDLSRLGEGGFTTQAFTSEEGERLDAEQISRDYAGLAAPVLPQAPATTEACGFLLMDTCPRTPTPEEQASYDSRMRTYRTESASYQSRRDAADAYGPCVRSPPRSPGQAPLDDKVEARCGMAAFVVAAPFPGGFAEAYYVGVYDFGAAARGRVQLEQYVLGKRGQQAPARGAPPPV